MLKELISSSMNTVFLRSSQYIESYKSDIEYDEKQNKTFLEQNIASITI